MYKSIFMYSLLAFSYFVFSTIPFTEVSAQTITITSGADQSTTRGGTYANKVTFTVTNGGNSVSGVNVIFGSGHGGSYSNATYRDATKSGSFSTALNINTDANGEVSIYVKADTDSLRDICSVEAAILIGTFDTVKFEGTITDVLNFSSESTTRSVVKGTAANTNIGAAVSATHWANADTDTTNDVTLIYSLEGTDKDSFSIDSGTGQLKTKAGVTYNAGNTYSVTIKVKEESGEVVRSSDTIDVTISVDESPQPVEDPLSIPNSLQNSPVQNSQNPSVDPPAVKETTASDELTVIRKAGKKEVTLSWKIPTSLNPQTISNYQYSIDGGQTWTSTGNTNTSITITGDGLDTLPLANFKIRAMNQNADGTRSVAIISARPQRRIIQECPVGWTRGSVFGKTQKALIYEFKVNVDLTNRTSIYQLASLAIYVHPEEGLENLDGWTLKVGTLYNHFGKEFKLTAENSVIDEHDFAHIKNPEGTPIPMGTLGYIGQSLPSFDYRLYDDRGARVDFGISCYKEGGLTWRLWNTEDPRVLRVLPFPVGTEALNVRMKNLDWNSPFFRTQWTAAIMPDLPDAPAAPSLVKKNIVGTWGDLKKQ